MTMTISNYIGITDAFNWPYNPNSISIPTDNDGERTHIPYSRRDILITGEGKAITPIVLQGHHSGDDRLTDYRDMQIHFNQEHMLKKLFFEANKFWLGTGKSCKRDHTGGRTNFVDYVALFMPIVALLFGTTPKTSGTNDGDASAPVMQITGTVTSGASDITVTDDINSFRIPSSSLSTSDEILYRYVQMTNAGGGIYVSEFRYVGIGIYSGTTTSTSSYSLVQSGQNFTSTVTVGDVVRNTTDSTFSIVIAVKSDTELILLDDIMTSGEDYIVYNQTRTVQTTSGNEGIPEIRPGFNVSSIYTTNLTGATITFRDTWEP